MPKAWKDMSEKDLLFLSKLLISDYDETEIKVLCALEFAKLKLRSRDAFVTEDGAMHYRLHHSAVGDFLLDADRFCSIVDTLDWLDEDVSMFQLPAQVKGYRPLESRLYGLRVDEWFVLDNNYAAFCNTKNYDYLDVMLAIMYRKNGDKWQDAKHLERWTRRFKNIAPHKKYIIFLWYTAVKLWLMKKYNYVFQPNDDGEQTPPDELLMGWLASLNDGRMADNVMIKASEVHEALYQLNLKIEQSKSIK